MKKTAAILMLLIISTNFADPLDCSVIKTCDQNGKCLEELWIMAKCTQNHIKVFEDFLKMNMPEKSLKDFEIWADLNGTNFKPKH